MKSKLIIIGASGHGKVVADIAIKMNKWKSIDFLDDNKLNDTVMSLNVIGKTIDALKYMNEAEFFVAIGDNKIREKILNRLMNQGLEIAKLIHPSAIIGTDVKIGVGTVVMAGVVINPSTKIGQGCIINTHSNLDHDNILEDFVHISPGVSTAGSVVIGNRSWLGVGSVVSNNIKISDDCIIGAGTVVIKNIDNSGTFVGVPARRIN